MEKSAAARTALSERQRRYLRGLAHALKPIIRIGNAGLTDGVALETERALHDHELIKVRAPAGTARRATPCSPRLPADPQRAVHRIGHVAVFYRARADLSRIVIPDT